MLMQISISGLVTIETLHLNLSGGSTMITGETGAGKSIFIEAIELALGGRGSQTVIRSGSDKAEISLTFDITHFPKVIARLKELDLYLDSSECIIRRVITSDGRSRCYINNTPSTVQLVKELGEYLFHLHSQHEQQVLLKHETQRDMLDRYADLLPLASEVKQLAESWRERDHTIRQLREKSLEKTDRCHYLQFQLDELNAAHLQPGEWESLETEHKKLAHAEELLRHLQHALAVLSENENNNVLSLLNDMRKTLDDVQSIEPKIKEWLETLQSSFILLNDLESELHDYLEQTNLDPEKLQVIEERVSLIFNLARKHKTTPTALTDYQAQLENELASLQLSDTTIAQLEAAQTAIENNYAISAGKLSEGRKKAAQKFEKEITETIRSLSLPHSEFKIAFDAESTPLALHGQEKVQFLIKINPDQTMQHIAKVVSGGELSRLSLAAHLALANKTTIPTLIFDEVDTGLSGATAEKIGKLLRQLGQSYQVFCVTHQAQVAACGHHHLLVEKRFIDKTTRTHLRLLNVDEKTHEIARMIAGEKITEKTLAHAREILEVA